MSAATKALGTSSRAGREHSNGAHERRVHRNPTVFSSISAVFLSRARSRPRLSLLSPPTGLAEFFRFLPNFPRKFPVFPLLFIFTLPKYQQEIGPPLYSGAWSCPPPLSPVEVIASEREHLQRRFE